MYLQSPRPSPKISSLTPLSGTGHDFVIARGGGVVTILDPQFTELGPYVQEFLQAWFPADEVRRQAKVPGCPLGWGCAPFAAISCCHAMNLHTQQLPQTLPLPAIYTPFFHQPHIRQLVEAVIHSVETAQPSPEGTVHPYFLTPFPTELRRGTLGPRSRLLTDLQRARDRPEAFTSLVLTAVVAHYLTWPTEAFFCRKLPLLFLRTLIFNIMRRDPPYGQQPFVCIVRYQHGDEERLIDELRRRPG
jgi:hypothetical protein